MLTVSYVDKDHLLLTFGVSRLMKRLPDCPPDDDDRLVKAVLLELPTAKVLAETEWRFHDLGQYLWDLGGGTFLLRQRETLTTFTPLDAAGAGGAFELHPFLKFDRSIEAILVSANHDLLSIETVKKLPRPVEMNASLAAGGAAPSTPAQASQGPAAPGQTARGLVLQRRDQQPDAAQSPAQQEAKADPAPVEISFVRLVHTAARSGADGPDRILASLAGRIRTKNAVNLPVTNDGFLQTKETTKDGVLFDFLEFTGKQLELGDFATSCTPKPNFVSPSEFVAFGCRGSDDSLDLAGFNLRGDLIWQMNFSDIHAYPSFVAAVPAGRFAMSRTLTIANIFGSETPSMSELSGQEVRVVQMYNGKLLLKVATSPIQRAGQNFALSPDGMALAVVHDTTSTKSADPDHETVHDPAIEIYKLPPLSARDQKEVAAEAALAPESANARIRFSVEEIKASLAKQPGAANSNDTAATEDSAESRRATHADERIVGDPAAAGVQAAGVQAAAAQAATGSIPSSSVAAGCVGINTNNPATGCPVPARPESAPETVPGTALGDDNAPRKPPTLYAPGEAHDSSGKSSQTPQ